MGAAGVSWWDVAGMLQRELSVPRHICSICQQGNPWGAAAAGGGIACRGATLGVVPAGTRELPPGWTHGLSSWSSAGGETESSLRQDAKRGRVHPQEEGGREGLWGT